MSSAEIIKTHPYLIRADGLGAGLFPACIHRYASNQRLAVSTAHMYIGEAVRHGKPYHVRIDYWDGREWKLVEEWAS